MARTLLSGTIAAALLAIASGHAATAGDYRQLAASAGLPADAAATMTLDEIAAAKFNQGSGPQDRHVIVFRSARAAGPVAHDQFVAAADLAPADTYAMDLDDVYVRVLAAHGSRDQRHTVPATPGSAPQAHAQLAASAGLAPDAWQTMSLDAIATAKFNRATRRDNRMPE
jgi:hypothetical protein